MTRAGEQLHISQSTLSKQIKAREEELGAKLFRRGHASVTPTDLEGVPVVCSKRSLTVDIPR